MEEKLSQHISSSLKGAWELARLNPRGMDFFNLDTNGFWRSFWAIPVGMPVYFLWLYVKVNYPETNVPAIPLVSLVIGYVLILPFSAFVMLYFTRFMKIADHYIPMVIAYNWVSVIVYALWVPIDIFLTSGVVGVDIHLLISFILSFYLQLMVAWFLFKTTLKITALLAAGIVLFDQLLSGSFMAILWTIFNPEYLDALKSMG